MASPWPRSAGWPPAQADDTLVTRMQDGVEVQVAKRHIIPRLQARIDRLGAQVDVIVLLCTGHFPEFRSVVPLLKPQGLVDRIVQAVGVGPGGRVGVMVPGEAQVEGSRRQMGAYGLTATVVKASPYADAEEVREAAETLRATDVKAIVMHCIGYTARMKEDVRRISGKPVLLARSLVGKILEETL